jgi:hypothetical protein
VNVSFGIRQKPPSIATPRFGGTLPLPRVDCTATTIIPVVHIAYRDAEA